MAKGIDGAVMTIKKIQIVFLAFISFVLPATAEPEVFSGNGGESDVANELIVYPGISSEVIDYHLGQKRHFNIRYSENINPETFSAELNGKSISNKFHPVPGTEEDIFLHLKPGENMLSIQVAGAILAADGTASSSGDLDTFTINLKSPVTKAQMLTTPPPGIEQVTLPPAAAENSKRPIFVIKSQQ